MTWPTKYEGRATSTALRRQRGLPPRHLAVVRLADESAESSGIPSPQRGFWIVTMLSTLLTWALLKLYVQAQARNPSNPKETK